MRSLAQTSVLWILLPQVIAAALFEKDSLPLKDTRNVVDLNPVRGSKPHSSQVLLRTKRATGNYSTVTFHASVVEGAFNVNVDFGGKKFATLFDTGSSDLWLAQAPFQCVDPHGNPLPVSQCAFGPMHQGSFGGGRIQPENFNITYGDGEFLTGPVGYEKVSLGGITVQKQEVALANYGQWNGDNLTSGLFGFAYPALTSAYNVSDPTQDNVNRNQARYNPWIINAVEQGLLAQPLFSIALERGPNGGKGQLALGGLPTIPFKNDFTSTPLIIRDLDNIDAEKTNYSYYTIIPDGFVLRAAENKTYAESVESRGSSAVNATNFPAIVDSGTTLTYLPEKIAQAVAASFSPPATYIDGAGIFEAECQAQAPSFAIKVGGTIFWLSAAEMLLQGKLGVDPNTGLCMLGIQPQASGGLYILGTTFLKNVIAVYDIGQSKMRFAPHEKY